MISGASESGTDEDIESYVDKANDRQSSTSGNCTKNARALGKNFVKRRRSDGLSTSICVYKGSISNVYFIDQQSCQIDDELRTLYAIHQDFPALCFKVQNDCPIGCLKEICETVWRKLKKNKLLSESKLLYRTSKYVSTLREVDDSEMVTEFANRATFIFSSKETPTSLTEHTGWLWSCNDCDRGTIVRGNMLNHLKKEGHELLWKLNTPPLVWGKEKTKLKDKGVMWAEPKGIDRSKPLLVFEYAPNEETLTDPKGKKQALCQRGENTSCVKGSNDATQIDSDEPSSCSVKDKSVPINQYFGKVTDRSNSSKVEYRPTILPASVEIQNTDTESESSKLEIPGNGCDSSIKWSEADSENNRPCSSRSRKSKRNVANRSVKYCTQNSGSEDVLSSDSGDDPLYKESDEDITSSESEDNTAATGFKSKVECHNKRVPVKKLKQDVEILKNFPDSDFEDGGDLEDEERRKNAQSFRRKLMAQALDEEIDTDVFVPDEDDEYWEKELLLKDAQVKSKKYLGKKMRIPLKQRKQMESGDILDGQDKIYQSSSPKERRNSMRRLMGAIQKERNMLFPGLLPNGRIKYRYWIDFREPHYIAPMNVMHLIDEFKSASVKCKLYGTYRKFLIQVSKYAESQKCLSELSKPRGDEELGWTPKKRMEEAQRMQFKIMDDITRVLNSMSADKPYAAWEAEKGENSAIRKEGKENFENVAIPNPNHIVPAYLDSEYSIELRKEMIMVASDPNIPITYEKLKEYQDDLALGLALKAGNRTEFYASLRMGHLASALDRGLIDIPWIDDINPELNVQNCKKFLQGYCLIGNFHKTLNKQNVWLWTTQPDMVLLRCIEELVTRYLTSIGIEVTADTPLFVSRYGGNMINSSQNNISFAKIEEITGYTGLTLYVFRKMFVDWQWSQCNAVLKECATYGTAHSKFVANKFYVSDKTKQLMSGMSHTAFWSAVGVLNEKEILELTSSNEQTERLDNMVKELRDKKLEEYLHLKSNTDIYSKPIESRLITEKAKGAFFEMVVMVKLNNVPVADSADVADIFLSEDGGKGNAKCRSLILRMLDLVPRNWECVDSLIENLVLSTPYIFRQNNLQNLDIKTATRKIEYVWAGKFGKILNKMRQSNKAIQNAKAIIMLKKLFLHTGSDKYALGNPSLLKQVKHWDMSKAEKETLKEVSEPMGNGKNQEEPMIDNDGADSVVTDTPSMSVPGEVMFEIEDNLVDVPKSPFKTRVRIGEVVHEVGENISVATVHNVTKDVTLNREGAVKFNDIMKRSLLKLFVLTARNPLVTRKCQFTEQCVPIWKSEAIDLKGDLIPLSQLAKSPETLGDIFHRRGKDGDKDGLKVPILEVKIDIS